MTTTPSHQADRNAPGCPRLNAVIEALGVDTRETGTREIDGTASDTDRDVLLDDSLMRHVATCTVCRRYLANHGHDLTGAIARLPREVTPPRDLWPEIADRLPPRPVRRRTPASAWLAAAALLTIGLAAGYVLGGWSDPGSSPSHPTSAPRTAAIPDEAERAVPASTTDPTATEAALAAYRDATRELRSAIETRVAALDPSTRAQLESHVTLIESAIGELEQALAETPENPRLEGLLLARYRQQVALLTRLIPESG